MTCRLTYAQLSRMHDNAEWAVRTYVSWGLYDIAARYEKIAGRIMNAMMVKEPDNIPHKMDKICLF